MAQAIKRGILQSFTPATYTASVLLLEAGSFALQNIPVATHIDGTSALPGSLCAVLFFDEQNYSDAVILACYPNGSQGLPTPAPGRVTFVAGYRQVNSDSIAAGSTNTYTLTGGSSGIPASTLAVLYKAYFTSTTVGAYVQLAPHGAADITAYGTIGNLDLAGGFVNGMGVIQLDSLGRIDVKANGGLCTFTLYTYGYVI